VVDGGLQERLRRAQVGDVASLTGLDTAVYFSCSWILLSLSALDELLPAALANQASVIAAGVFNSGVLADPDGSDELVNFFYRPAPAEMVDRDALPRTDG
jgi:hypothetical protein